MKISRKIFLATALAAFLGLGAAVGVHQAKHVKEVRADTTHRVVVKDDLGWYEGSKDTQAGKAAVYFYDGSSHKGWSKSFALKSGTGNVYVVEYTLSFTPTNMIVVRLKNSAGENPGWSDQAYSNQTVDLPLADATSLSSWTGSKVNCNQWAVTGNVYTSVDNFANPKVSFTVDTVEIVETSHPQVCGQVTLEKNEEFKVVNVADNTWSGYYGCPAALDSAFEGGSKTQLDGSNNIKCLIAGTYDFYFDTETKKTWITRDDIVDADGWASYFLANVGCDENGVNLPSGWSACAAEYAKLSGDAKDYVYAGTADENGDNLGRALARYDYAVSHHAGLTRFIVNSSSTPRAARYIPSSPVISVANNSALLITGIISLIVVSAVVGYIIIKKKQK